MSHETLRGLLALVAGPIVPLDYPNKAYGMQFILHPVVLPTI